MQAFFYKTPVYKYRLWVKPPWVKPTTWPSSEQNEKK